MKAIFQKIINPAGAVASILALVAVLFSGTPIAVYIALTAVIVFLSLVIWRFYRITSSVLRTQYPKGRLLSASTAYMRTEDGLHYMYEAVKHIQCKKPYMDAYTHGFHWSGKNDPQISSLLQKVGPITKTKAGDYDDLQLTFERPLLYNQNEVIHIKMELNDSDGSASPHLELRVEEPVRVIRWRVELRHKTDNEPAVVTRRRINENYPQPGEELDRIAFDQVSKSYEYDVLTPDVGFFYRIEWEK